MEVALEPDMEAHMEPGTAAHMAVEPGTAAHMAAHMVMDMAALTGHWVMEIPIKFVAI